MGSDRSPGRVAPAALYRLQLAVGGAGLAGSVATVAAGVRAVHVRAAGGHDVAAAGMELGHPAVNAAAALLLALGALGAGVLVLAARAAWQQASAHRQLVRHLPVVGPLAGHPAVRVIDAAEPLAFCAGWLRPCVYVSTAALERLSACELRAVLAHEHHHRHVRDPLRLAVGRVLTQALFFLPVLRPLHDRYGHVAEITADAAAVRATGGAAPLASALLAFDATEPAGSAGVSPERVDSLLGRSPSWRLPWLLLASALVTLAGVVVLAWRASASAQTSLSLHVASSWPSVLALALIPVLVWVVLRHRPRAGAGGALWRRRPVQRPRHR